MFTVEPARSSPFTGAACAFIAREVRKPTPQPAAAATARRGRGRPKLPPCCKADGCTGAGLYEGWCARHEHHHAFIPRFRNRLSIAWDRVWAPFWDHHTAQMEELAPRLKALGQRYDPEEQPVRIDVLVEHGLVDVALDDATREHRSELRAWREAFDERDLLRSRPLGDGTGGFPAVESPLSMPTQIRAEPVATVAEASEPSDKHPVFPWLRIPRHRPGAGSA